MTTCKLSEKMVNIPLIKRATVPEGQFGAEIVFLEWKCANFWDILPFFSMKEVSELIV